ncbi:MAG: guanylate kinase [Bacteroidetes bacterium]|nr:guanylate kinase [Bacteroidota bacterium]
MFSSQGKVIIFSAPSGAGKTTLVRHLLGIESLALSFSISATSRSIRGGEVDGKDYYFLSDIEFEKKIQLGAFLEWEEVYAGTKYGTLISEVERIWKNNKTVIFDVDVVGGLRLKSIFQDSALCLFVQPPSVDALHQRLVARSTESEEKIQQRVAKAEKEMAFANQFDAILVNTDLDIAKKEAVILVSDFLKK